MFKVTFLKSFPSCLEESPYTWTCLFNMQKQIGDIYCGFKVQVYQLHQLDYIILLYPSSLGLYFVTKILETMHPISSGFLIGLKSKIWMQADLVSGSKMVPSLFVLSGRRDMTSLCSLFWSPILIMTAETLIHDFCESHKNSD
jgi:hypothetical protein